MDHTEALKSLISYVVVQGLSKYFVGRRFPTDVTVTELQGGSVTITDPDNNVYDAEVTAADMEYVMSVLRRSTVQWDPNQPIVDNQQFSKFLADKLLECFEAVDADSAR
jgi:hypothetical protein